MLEDVTTIYYYFIKQSANFSTHSDNNYFQTNFISKMDDDQRTVWCGNLSEKVTEDILYELFLQGGPIQKVSIPKDRDGKPRTFGFVTFKHEISVPYVLELFQGTALFDRILTIKTRNNIEPQAPLYPNNGLRLQEPSPELQAIYQLPDVSMFANSMPPIPSLFGLSLVPHLPNFANRLDGRLGPRPNQDDGRSQRSHPYQREKERGRDRDRERDKTDYRDRSDHRERHSSHRSHDYGRSWNHRNKRKNYRQN